MQQDLKLQLLEKLVLVREFELACERWWKGGTHLVGEFHLSLGQEAFAVGTCAAAPKGDLICPSIRGMGVYLYRGTPLTKLIASFLERDGSISEGRWAHWHSPVMELGILPQTGMLGAGLVIANGFALAQKIRKTGKVVVAMLGDGTTNTGNFHEGINFAAVQDLPIVIVIENNQYAVSSPITAMARVENLSERAKSYGIPGETVDGTDVIAVHDAVAKAIARARAGQGASLLELKAYRWGGQTLKDADMNRPPEEKAAARQKCPIARLKAALVDEKAIRAEEFDAMVERTREMIEAAAAEVRARPELRVGTAAETLRKYPAYAGN